VLAARGDELRAALDAHDERGGRVAMVTLTMRHDRADSLEDLWDALGDAWRAATGRSRGARRVHDELGVVGWVRRVETTWGAGHGWHVHVHALVFLGADARVGDVKRLGQAMFDAWSARLDRVGLTPLRDHGGLSAELLELDDARQEVAGYVAKGSYTGESAAAELTGGGKLGRRGNLTPWGLLDRAVDGDDQARALWHEWERASAGRKAVTWSRGLREDLGLGEERADEEVAIEPVREEVDERVCSFSRSSWDELVRAHAELDVLEVAESADPALAGEAVWAFCRARGLPPPSG
jgi:hypothetical protein